MAELHLLDSITDARSEHARGVAISGSHGGLYPAVIASQAGLRGVIFNDAGLGLERAGVAGVLQLADIGMAAAATDCMTCRIGSAVDALEHGRISVVNDVARALGLHPGQHVRDAAGMLRAALTPTAELPPVQEARTVRTLSSGLRVHLLDSASMVENRDARAVVITGSHGGLIGGHPSRALKVNARLAVFNDAGGGKDGVGYGRLPALDERGMAAVTVSGNSARIGDAASALETGVISGVNALAQRIGATVGAGLEAFLLTLDRESGAAGS